MYLIIFFIMIVMSLISVAFITLMERKMLGLMQIRLGPNKVGPNGILQPVSDAIKLYTKEMILMNSSNKIIFMFCPWLSLGLGLIMWTVFPFFNQFLSFELSLLFLLSLMSITIYPILIAGWSSNSNYSLLGGMRSLAQSISYEVSLIFILLSNFIIMSSMKIADSLIHQKWMMFILFTFQALMWVISCLAEMSRTPFDFAEGESELVSGFNTEYSSGIFALIFMAEYMMILMFSFLTKVLFLSMNFMSSFESFITLMMIIFIFIWSRASFPRYRYDKLMYMCWKVILPLSTFNLMMMTSLNLLKLSKNKLKKLLDSYSEIEKIFLDVLLAYMKYNIENIKKLSKFSTIIFMLDKIMSLDSLCMKNQLKELFQYGSFFISKSK